MPHEAPLPLDPPGAADREYLVVARRYRPQRFDELIGQQHVARGLAGAIAAGRVGHAYLFTGARGVGKTSTARILAKALNCQRGTSAEPCGECDICRQIAAGSDVDVLEIDGASNRGIDEIRQLRQNVSVLPSRARFKIYIIDEVHMLTREAFNALLKTLEEPPEHVKFIFCTTEATKIPVTILSRCQRFDFAGIENDSIAERLAQIVATEGLSAEPEALEIIARRAAGSMRDSQSLLEQLLAVAEERITAADVHRLLGSADEARIAALVGSLLSSSAASALAEVDAAIAAGTDPGQLVEQLLAAYRDLMVAAAGAPATALGSTSSSRREELAALGRAQKLPNLLAALQILEQTAARLRYSTHGRLLVEMAVVRLCQLPDLEELAEVAGRSSGSAAAEEPGPAAPKKKAPAERTLAEPSSAGAARGPRVDPSESALTPALSQRERGREMAALSPRERVRAVSQSEHDVASEAGPSTLGNGHGAAAPPSAAAVPDAAAAPAAVAASADGDWGRRAWQAALAEVEGILGDHARLACVATSGPNLLVVSFEAKYNFSKEFCERPAEATTLAAAASRVVGRPVELRFELLPPSASAAPDTPRRSGSKRQRMAERSEHPLVKRLGEVFQAHAVDID